MAHPDQSASAPDLPPEQGAFPFPSLAFAGRLTIAPGELAARLAVPEAHIEELVANGHLKTRPRFVIGGAHWIAVDSMKQFILSRICGPLAPASLFLASVPYLFMRGAHMRMSLEKGEAWNYPETNHRMRKWPAFAPKRMSIIGQTALPVDRVCELLHCDEQGLIDRINRYAAWMAIDIRATDAGKSMHRVPVETYRFWVNMIFFRGSDGFFLRQADDLLGEIYLELGEHLGAKHGSQP
jgi:hypothetical protein